MATTTTAGVAIVGGGWAGLACAVELADHGVPVRLFEAARQFGGRARAVDWHGLRVDNGQHLMIGAYRATLDLMRRLGTHDGIERRPLDLRVPGFRLALPRLPAPLHLAAGLLAARGLALADKLAAARFMRALQATGFRLATDLPAAELLARHRQPAALVDRLWAPICIAALNTPLATASAQVFCNVLRDSLAGARADSDLVFNRADLGRLLPEAAAARVRTRGGETRLACKVEAVTRAGAGYRLAGPDVESDRVVFACHPARLPALLAGLPELAELGRRVGAFTWQPLATLWLRFAKPVALPLPMLGLGDGQAPWAFERDDIAPGVVSLVVSADGPHLRLPPETLRDDYLALLARELGPLPALLDWKLIVEKRATFACLPGLDRPGNATALPGVWLAGDYTAGDYPATLEGAVRSGLACAHRILENDGHD